ncbi:hypothetical protein [Alishewanella sp. HH-ZS]|uniref:hypothetical protein n=1 Tax=Alishewanella sp. HH-ZS TaxID=1856684 RepID=UPI00082367B1|nr:hypothetical protein [Alishewanella sp. HH-ZS]OCW98620.1 hypothetical protein A9165_00880 [Alishewanella sp. HH-ZS]
MRAIALLLSCCAVMLAACQHSRAAEPAVLSSVEPGVRQQLNDFIVSIVGGTSVTLADDVLMHSTELFIEQRMPVDSQGRPLDGRHSLPSYRFVLVRVGDSCILQHPGSGKSVRLNGARCQLAPR